MTNTTIAPPVQVIDQNFYIPEGHASMTYVDPIEVQAAVDENGNAIILSNTEDVVPEEAQEPDPSGTIATEVTEYVLPVPQDMTIVSQTLRFDSAGRQMVDVVIDTPDLDGVINFDVRVTKTG